MSDQLVSNLPALSGADVDPSDLLYIVDSSAGVAGSKKITVGQYQLAPVSAGTVNGVVYLDASKVESTNAGLTYDGTTLSSTGGYAGPAALTGTPTAPTAATGTNTTQIATTAFVEATKTATLISPALTGTPTAPTATTGTNTTQIATTAFVEATKTAIFNALHPVGSIYINATNATNPGTLLGFGTWTEFGAGRVPVGFNASNPLFDTAEETGGSADAITVSHTHTFSATTSTASLTGTFQASKPPSASGIVSIQATGVAGGADGNQSSATEYGVDASHNHSVSGTTDSAGSSGTNANYQPYITVYMWKRTA